MGDLRVGPAGWSYEDWKGKVYPQPAPPRFDPLEFLSRYFDVVEINSSFYRPPTATMTRSWARRVQGNPRFLFTAKLYQGFTHAPSGKETGPAPPVAPEVFLAGLGPIVEAGRFGALLLQFPWSFRFGEEARARVEDLWNSFRDLPLILEARHATWESDSALEFLRGLGIGFCNIDQPLARGSLRPAARVTGPTAYIRLHGRNAGAWFRKDAGVAERYNYLYSMAELEPWVERAAAVRERAERTFVVTNNHYQGKAVANALMLRARIEGRRVPAPPGLSTLYPELMSLVEGGATPAPPAGGA